MNETIRVRVPCSSANMGPGFDTLGIALTAYNYFEFKLADNETTIESAEGLDPDLQPMCLEMMKVAADYYFKQAGIKPVHFSIKFENHVPIARGLGSSATLRLAVMYGLNKLLKAEIGGINLAKWTADLEVCSDNAAASFFGGITASCIINDQLVFHHCKVSEYLNFVAVSPSVYVETEKARVFPDLIPRKDAIYTLSRGILFTLAFISESYEMLRDLFDERIHQPYRQKAIPANAPLYDVIQAAKQGGALGAYLSGSGSTVVAITIQTPEKVAQFMRDAYASYDMDSEVRLLHADNLGIQVEK